MATANFTWTPTPEAISQTLEYSVSPYTTWSAPISLSGTASTYSITGLLAGTAYEFRIMATCSAGPSTWTTYGPSSSPCTAPATIKFKASTINATHIADESSCAVNDVTWGTSGGVLFPEFSFLGGATSFGLFNTDGTAVPGYSTLALPSITLWENSPATTTNGRMNYCAISAGLGSPEVVAGFVGFAYTYYATSCKLIYIGVGTNAYASIRVNGVKILDQTESSADAGGSWKIYPVWVTTGPNFFQLGVTKMPSTSIGAGKWASFGIEVYDNTSAQILAATTATDLNIVFSTQSKAGSLFPLGDFYGYSCPLSDYYLDITIPSIGSYPQCVKII